MPSGEEPANPDAEWRERHVRYFKMCISILPHHYTGLDTSRMSLLYFGIIGLDMLGALEEVLGSRRQQVVDWVYNCQIPPRAAFQPAHCGFRGGPFLGHLYDPDHEGAEYAVSEYDSGHIAMTYTALAVLLTLGDDLARVHTADIIQAVAALQREDGSFTATLDGSECDMRYLYCACAISTMLGDWSGVNKDKAVEFIRQCLTFEGGISLVPDQEAHGGSTFTAVAALVLMNRLDALTAQELGDLELWCVHRQVGGFQGRCNKPPDTCYSFWVGGTLSLLGKTHLMHVESTHDFLEQCEQRIIGGYGKVPKAPPDMLHTFYSLFFLSLSQLKELQPMDGALAIRKSRLPQELMPMRTAQTM
uniref:Geranylgeranyl transferase type-1 subunit beta n=1 Tax=Rhizochromulina marina TaxID=1034831 RepID=A0A7S2WN64_9STRA|mmetsp:Transcript_29497/g.86004  ORF Transcript_29497/g.86004 Transcript_29497/m.86004 type:complete len:361 (+) Transcript_29497:88-1170(+)